MDDNRLAREVEEPVPTWRYWARVACWAVLAGMILAGLSIATGGVP